MRILMKKILCGIDFSDFTKMTLSYGLALCEVYGARLYVCHVIDLPSATIYGEGIANPLEQKRRITDYAYSYINELLGDTAVAWEPLVTIGHTADDIARLAAENRMDLVITATHGRSGLKRMLLGSVTERLMHTLPCPLMAVRRSEKAGELIPGQPIEMKRILVGCDFSSDSELAFNYGLSLAQEFESELHLVHVIEPPVYESLSKSATEAPGAGFEEDLRLKLKKSLEDMVPQDARPWCRPVTALVAGRADEELTKYALVNKMDLVVLGVRGHGLVEKLFIGSTTDRLMRQAHCPVLSVQPKAGLEKT
jgi:nucleotide-binding universal stress UspA family protein